MGLISDLFRGNGSTSSSDTYASRGRTAGEVETDAAQRGSTGKWSRGSYVERKSTGGHHRHDPGSDGRYRCACGC